MSSHLKPEASVALELYLEEVRSILRGSTLDVDEVISDIRDHVREAAAASGSESLTRDEVEAVLDRLGPPSRWMEEPSPPDTAPDSNPATKEQRLALGVFGLTFLGLALLPWVGPLALLAAWILARAVDERFRLEGSTMRGWHWLVLPPLVIGAVAAGALLLLGPAVPLIDYAGTARSGGLRSAWAIPVAGIGVWWVLLGLLVRARSTAFRWLLHPFPIGARHGSRLAGLGAAFSIVGFLLLFVI